ncbi:thiamine pyrophosphate-binding protein [Priestia megaterium]|uniref:thiamine pyrophosphate-binding protein n=1 Tax=Priestia megaterium TaxID=1404 RepID=UPI002079F3DF|nr:thiamine pyrophosphate-binding protein [Priestia megaterium]USL45554.1 hypothetical protein LIS78_29600 [Priestia megaterium]
MDDLNLQLATSIKKQEVKYVLTVPCTILSKYYDESITQTIYLSREEEGVGLASGLTVSNQNAILMMQNSGLGNCINAFASLTIPYNIGFVVIVSMRGDELEDNPVQIPMGNATKALIKSIGCKYYEINQDNDLTATIDKAFREVHLNERPVFVLLPRKEHLQ